MIRTLTLIFLAMFFVSGCSYLSRSPRPQPMLVDPKKPEIISESQDQKTGLITVTKTTTKRFSVDDSKPTSFADYKQWRRENDPGGQTYAEFKQWEAVLKERKLRQQQNKVK